VALLGWLRSPQITIGSSASHLPPFLLVKSKILFFKPSIISPLMRSTWPLALGCATDTYLISMLEFSQKSQNSYEVKFDPRSVMIVFGKPNLWSISLMNSTARSDDNFLIGLTSIHLVNLSTATRTCVKPPGAVGSGPIISRLQQAKGQDGGMVIRL